MNLRSDNFTWVYTLKAWDRCHGRNMPQRHRNLIVGSWVKAFKFRFWAGLFDILQMHICWGKLNIGCLLTQLYFFCYIIYIILLSYNELFLHTKILGWTMQPSIEAVNNSFIKHTSRNWTPLCWKQLVYCWSVPFIPWQQKYYGQKLSLDSF